MSPWKRDRLPWRNWCMHAHCVPGPFSSSIQRAWVRGLEWLGDKVKLRYIVLSWCKVLLLITHWHMCNKPQSCSNSGDHVTFAYCRKQNNNKGWCGYGWCKPIGDAVTVADLFRTKVILSELVGMASLLIAITEPRGVLTYVSHDIHW